MCRCLTSEGMLEATLPVAAVSAFILTDATFYVRISSVHANKGVTQKIKNKKKTRKPPSLCCNVGQAKMRLWM